MAAESSRSSSSSADSYIGSLISLTSKSEIRYEGILNNINTEESSIGLRNVRSFGTEGRKKDGPQLMPSHTVYEYILFRGSDIKDLQVKSSLPVQPTQPIHNDPAIIQSHYPQPAPISSSLPAAASNSLPDPSIHNAQMGHPGSTLQGALPLYQPGVNLGSWGPMPPPPNANSSGLAMPMYWPGFYAPPNGIPQLHQQSLVQPAPLSVSPLQQPMQYPSYNASLSSGAPNLPTSSMPDNPSPLLPTSTSSANTTSTSLLGSTLTSSLPPGPPSSLPTDTLPSLTRNKPPNSVVPTAVPLNGGLQSLSSSNTNDVNVTIPPVFDKRNVPSEANLPYQGMSFPISSVARTTPVPTESPTPSLITPGQLLQSGQTVVVSSQFTQAVHKDVEVVQVSPTPPSEPSAPIPVPTEAQPPILPLPPQSPIALKRNGAPYQNHQSYNYRGRDRGRGSGGSRPVVKFTEEFDFNAMNEKFNKDEVWGTLGKSNKFSSKEKDGNASDEDEYEDENDADIPKLDAKPVYSKDDFFDTLSSNSLDNQSNNGRIRFSDQMKLDTETFGEFSRYRGSRIGRGSYRGGRSRGGGYYGRGYSYVGRGRSGRIPYPTRDY